MFILVNLLIAVAQVLDWVLWAYIWILIGRFLYGATEPVLERVRQRLPVLAGGFDFSPVVVWIAIVFLQRFLVRSLYELAQTLR
jgi:YggT family protein